MSLGRSPLHPGAPVSVDFFIMIMAVLEFMLMQINSSSMRVVYNQSIFRIFKVFKSLRALRAIRVLRRLRSADPQLPTRRLQTPACFSCHPLGSISLFSREGLGHPPPQVTSKSGTSHPCNQQSESCNQLRLLDTDPHPTDSASLSTSVHSFLTSLQEVTGTLAQSLPSITAILILMFTCLCILCHGGWGGRVRCCNGRSWGERPGTGGGRERGRRGERTL